MNKLKPRAGATMTSSVKPRTREAKALLLIGEEGPRSRQEIGAHIGLSVPQAVTDLLKRLRVKGLLVSIDRGTAARWCLTLAGAAEADRIDPQGVTA